MKDDPVFWFFWGSTLCICSWNIIQAVIKPIRLLEWPFIVSVMWAYFYVYMAYDAAMTFSDFISQPAYILGSVMPLVTIICMLLGWKLAKPRNAIRMVKFARIKNEVTVWFVAIILVLIGAYGGWKVQSIFSSDRILYDYEESSAYIYLLFYIGYPGLALAIWIATTTRAMNNKILWAFTICSLLIFIFPHVAGLRRGPTFPAVILLLIVPPLAIQKPPNILIYITGIIFAGIAMLAYLPLRQVIYNNGEWENAIEKININSVLIDRNKELMDNEYINNCYMLYSIAESGKYDYGTGHLTLLFHWIPRSLWPTKPRLGGGLIQTDSDLVSNVEKLSGVPLIGGGAAAGCVADSFLQYSYFCPLFWMGISYLVGYIYWSALRNGNTYLIHAYIGIVCATHWLVSQAFASAYVQLLVFSLLSVTTIYLSGGCRKNHNWTSSVTRINV